MMEPEGPLIPVRGSPKSVDLPDDHAESDPVSRSPDLPDLGDAWTEDGLIDAAGKSGYVVTPRDLKRYRMEGLLQRPRQVYQRGQRGSASLYPHEAKNQLLAICLLHKEERRFNELRFHLWWERYWVEPAALKASVQEILEEELSFILALRAKYKDAFDAADRVIEWARASRVRKMLMRSFHVRVGNRRFDLEGVLYAMVLLAMGEEPAWESPEVDVELGEVQPGEAIEEAFWLKRSRTDVWEGAGPLMDEGLDLPAVFERAREMGIFPLDGLLQVLDEATTDELNQARRDARIFSEEMRVVVAALESVVGRGAFGLGMIREWFSSPHSRYTSRAGLLAIMLAMRPNWTPEELQNFQGIEEALKRAAPLARTYLAMQRRRRGKRVSPRSPGGPR